MKVTSPLVIFAIAAAADAAALAGSQEDKRWCTLPGQPCFKRDAAANALTESLANAGGLSARDDGLSAAAAVAKRQIDALSLAIAASQGNPGAYYYGLNLPSHFAPEASEKREADPWCTLPGQPCFKKRSPEDEKRWCTLPGQPCFKKRDGEEDKRDANPWCTLPGQPCFKRRDADSLEDKRWCTLPGQPCFKAKRAAEAVISAITATHENEARSLPFAPEARLKREAAPWCTLPGQPCFKKRDTIPVPDRRSASPWCTLPGQPCFKKRSVEEEKRWCARSGQPCWKRDAEAEASCNAPGGACTMAQRDLHAVYNIARGIVDAHSE